MPPGSTHVPAEDRKISSAYSTGKLHPPFPSLSSSAGGFGSPRTGNLFEGDWWNYLGSNSSFYGNSTSHGSSADVLTRVSMASSTSGILNTVIGSELMSTAGGTSPEGNIPPWPDENLLTAEGAGVVAMNGSMNAATWPIRDPLYVVIPITIIYAIILITGLLGNVVTCIVIVRSRYLHTATNFYLFSLAISDLFLLVSGLPVEMHSMWRRYPDIFGETVCIGRGLISETGANATVLTITAFTVERYLAICRPFMIQKWSNKLSRVARQIVIIWILSVILAIPQAMQLGVVPVAPGISLCTVKETLIEYIFEISTFVFFVGPMILITVLYILIGLTLRNASHVKESKLRLRKSLSNQKRELGQQRVLKMLVAVVVAFFLCWAPFHAQRLIWKWTTSGDQGELSEQAQTLYTIATYVSGVLYYVATCVNPVLYHTMSLKFRHAFKVTMADFCACNPFDKASRTRKQELFSRCSLQSHGINLQEISSSASAATHSTYASHSGSCGSKCSHHAQYVSSHHQSHLHRCSHDDIEEI